MEDLPDGAHSISVAIKPDNVRFYYNKSDHMPSVNFTVRNQSSEPESGTQQLEPDYVMVASATAATMTAVTSLGLFFYFKKRRLVLEK